MEYNPDVFPDMRYYQGPLLAGFILTALLYGASIMLFVNYLQFSYPTDRKGTRILAFATAFVGLAAMIFAVCRAMRHFAFRFGEESNADDARFDSASYLLGGVAHVLAGGFFARRAWKIFNRPVYLGVILTALILTTAVGALGAAISGMTEGAGVRSKTEDIFNYFLFISITVGDVSITALITTKLYMSKSGWVRTDSLIHKLIVLVVEAQAPPAITAIAFLITYVGAPYQSYILAYSFIPMIYVLSLFAALQSRHTMSAHMESDKVESRRTLPPSIHITTEIYTHAAMADLGAGTKRRQAERGAGRLVESVDSLHEGQEDLKDYNNSEVRLV